MNKTTLYYDYINNEKTPIWLVVENMDWSNPVLYLPTTPDYESDINNFHHDNFKVSVLLSDLLQKHSIEEKQFGINLATIELRIKEYGYDKENIEGLVIRVVDLKEVIYMDRVIV